MEMSRPVSYRFPRVGRNLQRDQGYVRTAVQILIWLPLPLYFVATASSYCWILMNMSVLINGIDHNLSKYNL
jgi:hypothetical protein